MSSLLEGSVSPGPLYAHPSNPQSFTLSRRFFVFPLVALLVSLSFTGVLAECYKDDSGACIHWPSPSVILGFSSATLPDPSRERDLVLGAVRRWNSLVGSSFRFVVGPSSSAA